MAMHEYYNKSFAENECVVLTNKKMICINRNWNRIVLKTDVESYEADIAINCSFTKMNLGLGELHQINNELAYQETVCSKFKTSDPPVCITIKDVNYPTIYPTYWDENSTELDSLMLYHVKYSVCSEKI